MDCYIYIYSIYVPRSYTCIHIYTHYVCMYIYIYIYTWYSNVSCYACVICLNQGDQGHGQTLGGGKTAGKPPADSVCLTCVAVLVFCCVCLCYLFKPGVSGTRPNLGGRTACACNSSTWAFRDAVFQDVGVEHRSCEAPRPYQI